MVSVVTLPPHIIPKGKSNHMRHLRDQRVLQQLERDDVLGGSGGPCGEQACRYDTDQRAADDEPVHFAGPANNETASQRTNAAQCPDGQ